MPLSVSSLLSDYRGIGDVCLSVPSIVNARGVETALPIPALGWPPFPAVFRAAPAIEATGEEVEILATLPGED